MKSEPKSEHLILLESKGLYQCKLGFIIKGCHGKESSIHYNRFFYIHYSVFCKFHLSSGYIIAEQHCIYPLFSGHNTICVVTALLETGQLPITEPATFFKLEAPGGLISIEARCEQGRVREVRMRSMAAFVGKVT